MTMQQHPLDISELRVYIGRFLDGESAKACSLVCKTWHEDLRRFVWLAHRTPLMKDSQDASIRTLWEHGVRKNGCWIRHINGQCTSTWQPWVISVLSEHCQSLLSIRISFTTKPQLLLWMPLIRLNRELQTVELSQASDLQRLLNDPEVSNAQRLFEAFRPITRESRAMLSRDTHFWNVPEVLDALQGLERLRHLELWAATVPYLLRILQACPSLRELTVSGVMGKTSEPEGEQVPLAHVIEALASTTFPLCRLEMGSIRDGCPMNDLLSRLPALESLSVRSGSSDFRQSAIQLLSEGRWPFLSELVMNSPADCIGLMEAIPVGQLRSAVLPTLRSSSVLALLERQGPTLERLSIQSCDTGLVLARLFYECPRLKELELQIRGRVKYLDLRDLLFRPWVLQDLERLSVHVGIDRFRRGAIPSILIEALQTRRLNCPSITERDVAIELFQDRINQLKRLRRRQFAYRIK
ncbi:hypothetical protein DFQ27_001596 [Actinomortierella ambigua]|uniref:F-box domain-containing protein n=1 Tax=Actinomortierella ambigua TaxID=1343610 RepID=A0A9P6QA58_9FUNG|nr:hypothetical protein DFQ27_001596 [Actinomortierella ambigua]